MKPTLVQFLKTRRVDGKRLYARFVANVKKRGRDPKEYIKTYKHNYKAVWGAFVWRQTSEGLDFWGEVSDKWESICNK